MDAGSGSGTDGRGVREGNGRTRGWGTERTDAGLGAERTDAGLGSGMDARGLGRETDARGVGVPSLAPHSVRNLVLQRFRRQLALLSILCNGLSHRRH